MTAVSTLAQHLRLQSQIRLTKLELNKASLEVSSRTHADYYEGLDGQTTRGMALRTAFSQIGFYQESANLAATQLQGQQEAIGQITHLTEEVRDLLLGVQNGADNSSPRTISEGAGNYLAQLRGALNAALAGRYLFAGPATNAAPLRDPNDPSVAAPPADVMESLKVAHDLTDAAGIEDYIAEIDQVFDGTHPTFSFIDSFYGGSVLGTVTSSIDRDQQVSLDVRATDAAFKDVIKSLYILTYVPEAETTSESYKAMAVSLSEKLTQGLGSLNDVAAIVGYRQQLVADTRTRHDQASAIVNNTIANLESVDDYDAASRLTILQSQMEISYTVTARLSNLSFINFI